MTSPPLRIAGLGDRAAAVAVAVLVLAAGPGDVHGAQRTDGLLAEPPPLYGAAVESIESGGARPSQPESSRWPHGLQLAELRHDAGTLGEAASKAVSQWPAAQKADPAWEWVRVLVFLAQLALVEQGYDPGRPDGMMGPNTMMALLRWHAQSGEPLWIGLVNTVAYLIHGTLEAKGLEPGSRQQFLGPRSKAALEGWDGIFRTGATNVAVLGADAELTRDWVMRGFGQGPSPDTEDTASQSAVGSSSIGSQGTGQSKHECLKVSWNEEISPYCYDYGHLKGICRWALNVHNTCGYMVMFHVLGNFGTGRTVDDGRGTGGRVHEDWRTRGWGIQEIMEVGENWGVSGGRPTGDEGVWDMPEGIRPEISYCVNRWEYGVGHSGQKIHDWYENTPWNRETQVTQAVNIQCLADK